MKMVDLIEFVQIFAIRQAATKSPFSAFSFWVQFYVYSLFSFYPPSSHGVDLISAPRGIVFVVLQSISG